MQSALRLLGRDSDLFRGVGRSDSSKRDRQLGRGRGCVANYRSVGFGSAILLSKDESMFCTELLVAYLRRLCRASIRRTDAACARLTILASGSRSLKYLCRSRASPSIDGIRARTSQRRCGGAA